MKQIVKSKVKGMPTTTPEDLIDFTSIVVALTREGDVMKMTADGGECCWESLSDHAVRKDLCSTNFQGALDELLGSPNARLIELNDLAELGELLSNIPRYKGMLF